MLSRTNSESSIDAMGMRVLFVLQENSALGEKVSVELILLEAGDLEMTLCFPQERECMRG